MKHNKSFLTLGAVMVALVAVVGLSVASFAASDDVDSPQGKMVAPCFNTEKWQERKAGFEAKRAENKVKMEAVKTALEAGDYQAYLSAVADTPMAEEITEEEFPRLLEAHNLAEEGKEKLEQARQIREELGLKPFQGKMGKFRQNIKSGLGQPELEK